jgi:hypothetical protein
MLLTVLPTAVLNLVCMDGSTAAGPVHVLSTGTNCIHGEPNHCRSLGFASAIGSKGIKNKLSTGFGSYIHVIKRVSHAPMNYVTGATSMQLTCLDLLAPFPAIHVHFLYVRTN